MIAREDDSNVPGRTPLEGSVFVDPSPPTGWTQCAGFKNTAGDDIGASFLDACMNTKRLRVRVFTAEGLLEEDVSMLGMTPSPAWPDGYLEGVSSVAKSTNWGGMNGGAQSVFFTRPDGSDACQQSLARSGTTFGSGHAEKASVVVLATGYDEYRLSCGKGNLPDRKIAFYR